MGLNFYCFFFPLLSAVKEVVLDLSPLLTSEKLVVSVAAGIKLKDLQVQSLPCFHIRCEFFGLIADEKCSHFLL